MKFQDEKLITLSMIFERQIRMLEKYILMLLSDHNFNLLLT